jgi:hypothetical protein
MLQKIVNNYASWRYKRKIKKIRKMILSLAAYPPGIIGTSKTTGRKFKVRDVTYSVMKNKIDYDYKRIN